MPPEQPESLDIACGGQLGTLMDFRRDQPDTRRLRRRNRWVDSSSLPADAIVLAGDHDHHFDAVTSRNEQLVIISRGRRFHHRMRKEKLLVSLKGGIEWHGPDICPLASHASGLG